MLYSQAKMTVIKDCISRYPDAENRVWRGALLHHKGHAKVQEGREGLVLSSNRTRWYKVRVGKRCDCPDTYQWCKHQWALYFKLVLV